MDSREDLKQVLRMDVSDSPLRIGLKGLTAPSEKILYRAKVLS